MRVGSGRTWSLVALVSVVGLALVACTGGEVREPLRVADAGPAAASENVWIRDPVWVRFSEPVDPATVTPGRVVVSSAEVASLAKELSLSADGLTLSITLTQQPVLPATLTVALSRDIATADGRRLVPPVGGWWWNLPAWQAMGDVLDVDPGRNAIQPRVVVGPQGPVVAWSEEGAGIWEVRVKAWVDGAWSSLGGALNHGPTNDAERVRSAIDPSGAPVVAWAEQHGDDWNVYAKRWDGAAWATLGPGPLDADPTRAAHGVDVASDGVALWVAWHEQADGGTNVNVRRWEDPSWAHVGGSAADPAWAVGGPSIGLGGDGFPVVAFTMPGTAGWRDVRACRWTGTEWTPLGGALDVEAHLHATEQDVAVGPDNAPVVVWEEADLNEPSTSTAKIHAKRWDGAGWVTLGGPLNAGDPSTSHAYQPSVTIDAEGRPVVVWREDGVFGIRVHAKRWTGSAWEAMGGPISDRWSEPADVAVGADGVFYVTWSEHVGDTEDVFVKRFNELP